MDGHILRMSDPAVTAESQPAQFAAMRLFRAAERLNEAIDAQHVITGLLNAAVSFAFWSGMSAIDTERLLELFKGRTGEAFTAMQAAERAKAP